MILAEICGRGTDCRGAALLAMTARRCRAVRPPLGGGCRRSRLGERETAWHLSLRQRFALTPPSQREAQRNGFPRQCEHWLGMTRAGRRGRRPLRKMRVAAAVTGGAMWASSPTERRRGVPYRRRSQDMLATARPPMRTVTAPSFSYRTLRISDGRDMCSPCRNTFSSPGFTSPRR